VSTRVRKVPLVIHVEGAGLLVLKKSCRVCPSCEVLIVHQDELEPLIEASFPSTGAAGSPLDYLILGTIDREHWRTGRAAGSSISDLVEHLADFKGEVTLEVTAEGWCPTRPRD
jgi:hypothetical protein